LFWLEHNLISITPGKRLNGVIPAIELSSRDYTVCDLKRFVVHNFILFQFIVNSERKIIYGYVQTFRKMSNHISFRNLEFDARSSVDVLSEIDYGISEVFNDEVFESMNRV